MSDGSDCNGQAASEGVGADRKFINELGNAIEINVELGAPGCLCRFGLHGPDSSIESYTTRMELEQLRDALNEALPANPLSPNGDETPDFMPGLYSSNPQRNE